MAGSRTAEVVINELKIKKQQRIIGQNAFFIAEQNYFKEVD
jgi:hypothetical protein